MYGTGMTAATQVNRQDFADSVAPDAGLLDQIGQRLSALDMVLNETNVTLGGLRSRLWGPWPETANGALGKEAPPMGNADAILRVLDRALDQAREGSNAVAFLNNRL